MKQLNNDYCGLGYVLLTIGIFITYVLVKLFITL